jgi:hypothetical protein
MLYFYKRIKEVIYTANSLKEAATRKYGNIIMQVSNQTITSTTNLSARTFTIRTYIEGKINNKYRTVKLSKEEFELEMNNTQNDWKQFLKSSDYYLVKSY